MIGNVQCSLGHSVYILVLGSLYEESMDLGFRVYFQ